ncbi:MAG: VOC family protein [Pyrinomonadaceae bacterium]
MKVHFILYVSDQERSTAFYSDVLGEVPSLNVPGMTEFRLKDSTVLGLMPETGIVKLLGPAIVHPALARGVPRSEVYLVVENPAVFYARAIAAGARELSQLALRDWGHQAAYCLDPDGHVLAFAAPAGTDLSSRAGQDSTNDQQ